MGARRRFVHVGPSRRSIWFCFHHEIVDHVHVLRSVVREILQIMFVKRNEIIIIIKLKSKRVYNLVIIAMKYISPTKMTYLHVHTRIWALLQGEVVVRVRSEEIADLLVVELDVRQRDEVLRLGILRHPCCDLIKNVLERARHHARVVRTALH